MSGTTAGVIFMPQQSQNGVMFISMLMKSR